MTIVITVLAELGITTPTRQSYHVSKANSLLIAAHDCSNGSYYYSNPNGSTYYNNGESGGESGASVLTA